MDLPPPPPAATPSGSRALKLALVALFAGVVVAFFALGGHRYLSLDAIKANRDALLAFTQQHFAASLAIAFVVYVAVTAFSLPGGLVLSLTVGFLFGRWIGTALVVVAATIGATLVFVAARYVFADAARRRLGAFGERINAGFTENAFSYLLFLRLVPLFPFFLVNLAPAFTSIPLSTYALATFVGVIPGTFVFVNLGQTLGRIESLQGLVSAETLGAFALLGVFALVPVAIRKLRAKKAATPAA
ncbi:MAG: TVP38/TMEM64 family protein [Betaproteobacteria bacterium]|nr:TVP38/TMEM64 family protein [Betaproteobacteria bacterium]